jgi:hypothetical protein
MTREALGLKCIGRISCSSHFWRRCSILQNIARCQPLRINIMAWGSTSNLLMISRMEVIAVKVSQSICRPRVAAMTFKHINCLASWSCWTMVMWLAIGFKIWCSSIARAQHAGDGSGKSSLPIKMVTAQLLAMQGPSMSGWCLVCSRCWVANFGTIAWYLARGE